MANPAETYTVNQAAEILGISVRSVYRYVEGCRAAFLTLTNGENNRLVFRAGDLDALGKLVNLRKTTGVKLDALRKRFSTAGKACQEQANPEAAVVEVVKPENLETGPSLQDLAAQVVELRSELEQLRAERAEDRTAMVALMRRLARLDRPALPAAPTPRSWKPLVLPPSPAPSKPGTVSWWRAFLWPELQRRQG